MAADTSTTPRRATTGLRQFLGLEQQRGWIDGKVDLRDADERPESLELRLKYVPRFQKLLRHPQAQEVLDILKFYGQNCIPVPRLSERHFWSVSCLPSTSDKPVETGSDELVEAEPVKKAATKKAAAPKADPAAEVVEEAAPATKKAPAKKKADA